MLSESNLHLWLYKLGALLKIHLSWWIGNNTKKTIKLSDMNYK